MDEADAGWVQKPEINYEWGEKCVGAIHEMLLRTTAH